MKILWSVLLLLSGSVMANTDYEVEVETSSNIMYAMNLNCILPQGNESRIYTQLDVDNLKDFVDAKIDHRRASTEGCDQKALEALVLDSHMRFGSVSVEIDLIKRIANNDRMVFGKCQRNYDEQIVIKFNYGLTLKTGRVGKLIPAKNCN